MTSFPVISSTLAPKPVGQLLEEKYGLSSHTTCKLLRTGINHSYIVADRDRKFIFRIYSHNWRSLVEIAAEVGLLSQLAEQDVRVSYPIQDLTTNYIQVLPAPEGVRYGVLFSFAEGRKVRDFSAQTSHAIGVLMAQIHNITQNQTLPRTNYTPYTLTQLPYALANTHFPASNEEMIFVKQLGELITAGFLTIDKNAVRWGGVHLDIWYDNMSISEKSEVILFDFDFCGNGYLFYDIAYFVMQLYHTEPDKQRYQHKLDAFFNGYQTISVITQEERKWLPLAGAAVWIFYLGVQSQRFDDWSNIFLSENYLKRYISMVKDWLQYNRIEISVTNVG